MEINIYHFPSPLKRPTRMPDVMTVLSCLSMSANATPASGDSLPVPSIPSHQSIGRQSAKTSVTTRKNSVKLSTDVTPADEVLPPVTSKLRKYWGEDVDPLTSDGYMWNKDFMERMKKLIRDPDADDNSSESGFIPEESSGFLSLNRVMSLDNMEVDLSKELTAFSGAVVEQIEEEKVVEISSKKWRPAPTRREQERWDRATKAATGGSDVMLRESRRPTGDPQVLAAEAREQYFKLKNKLFLFTLSLGGVGVVSSYFSYTPEITVSYGAGLIGSLVYMRMLGTSVDALADGAKGLIKGAIAQPRLLVPVVLVMLYNRWNGILVPEYGFMHLELIPMLVGFFTYKIATFFQAFEEAISSVDRTR